VGAAWITNPRKRGAWQHRHLPFAGLQILRCGDDLKVVIHPNPSTESVNIRLNKKVSGLQLIVADISGRTLLQKEYRSESNSYFFPYQLEPGVYFFTILTVDENVTKKVIVTR
jgi:hypothetical protein